MTTPSQVYSPQPVSAHHPRDLFADVGRCRSTGRLIRLCYNTFGSAEHPCILLVMGLASPAMFWDDVFCTALALSGPHYVIRFDNRDVGCSTHVDKEKSDKEAVPTSSTTYLRYAYAAMRPGTRTIDEVYTLDDMAADAFGLLDALRISLVHLVGSSLGGTVVQCMALTHPERVLSLTLMSTHTNSPHTQWPSLREMMSFISLMPKSTSAKYANRIAEASTAEEQKRLCAERDAERVNVYSSSFAKLLERLSGDPKKYPFDRVAAERQMRRIFRRSLYVAGAPRQFLALLNAPSREEALRQRVTSVPPSRDRAMGDSNRNHNQSSHPSTAVAACPYYIPTVIIQGDCDPLVPASNARRLAATIPQSRLFIIEGMGHTLIPALRDTYIRIIRDNVCAGEAAARLPERRTRPPAATGASAESPPTKTLSRL